MVVLQHSQHFVSSIEDSLLNSTCLISGTGWESSLEHHSRKIAAQKGIYNITLLDHWVNYNERFERDGDIVLPNEIWVTDGEALEMARNNLFSSGIKENVYVTGNTIIDALQMISKISKPFLIDGVNLKNKNLILATVHRRENWGENLKNIAYGLRNIIENDNSAILIIPLHKNPKVREPLKNILKGNKRIILTEPLDYDELISILKVCKFVITDSGGLQEESPTFGKPVLVIRKSTERLEAVEAGCAKLIGVDQNNIFKESIDLLNNREKYLEMSKIKNPFGQGDSSKKIFMQTLKFLDI